ncbi:MAG: adenosylmethionine decarboxylase [Candidatus Caenarcaniphilales bacterium]|nr:adenosylmethionine decarboxylase [Candidatus Caenarcaniphilales bacterium]
MQHLSSAGFLEQKVAPDTHENQNSKLDHKLSPKDTEYFATLGRHVIADLSGCEPDLLSSVSKIQEILEEAVKKAGATIIKSNFHQFQPIGVSGVILLSESHCSIHTWPEKDYAAIDIYTCGEHVFPQVACEYIAKHLKASEIYISSLERGIKDPVNNSSFVHFSNGAKQITSSQLDESIVL